MKNIVSSYSLLKGYGSHTEKDIAIRFFGYDDFNAIEPIKIPRTQNMFTLHFIMRGSGTLKINGKTQHLKKYDMFFIPPNIPFCYYPDKNDKWAYIWFDFVGENARRYGELIGFSGEVYAKHSSKSDECFRNIADILQLPDIGRDVGYYDILSLFYKLIAANSEKTQRNEYDCAEIAAAYVRNHYYDSELSVERICKNIGISHSHMCRIFKKEFGMTLSRYITDTRISEASRLLTSTDLSVKEITFAVGFNDYPHFVKTFKAKTGCCASEYRKRN